MKIQRLILCATFFGAAHVYATGPDTPYGLICGAQGGGPGYAGSLALDGTLTQLTTSGFPTNSGLLYSVAINDNGFGLVCGEDTSGLQPAYALFVFPNGTVTQLSGNGFPSSGGILFSAAINQGGVGLIGGQKFIGPMNPAYAALVMPDGTVGLPLSGVGLPTNGVIRSVAINNNGVGLIGGKNSTPPGPGYAAVVHADGTLGAALSGVGFPTISGIIFSVAINNNAIGLIGGQNTNTQSAYVAIVHADGTLSAGLTGAGFPSTDGYIQSVAINDNGVGLIGGRDLTGTHPAYAAFVHADGTLGSPLSGPNYPTNGFINSVSINSSGTGLIGGSGATAYAAFVAPNGTLTELTGLPMTGNVTSVAINDPGVGLIAVTNTSSSNPVFIALAAPNGTITQITGGNLPTAGSDYAVALNNNFLAAVVPKFWGSFLSAINTQLAATYALEVHLTTRSSLWPEEEEPNQSIGLLVDNSPQVTGFSEKKPLCNESKYTVWAAPFGNYVHQKAQGKNPSLKNDVAGGLLGFDGRFSDLLLGAALGYAHNSVHYGENLGHGYIQEELACFYGIFQHNVFSLNFALWGGLYQFENKRNTLSLITSTAHTHGWIFSPHLEFSFPIKTQNFIPHLIRYEKGKKPEVNSHFLLDPFVMFDWVNNWQHHFTEKGASGMNIVMDDHYGSLLRSEAGLRFFEQLTRDWGNVVFEQKLSYVNQTPFQIHNVTTFFVASASTFPIAIGSSKIQNLGAAEFRFSILPCNHAYPYITVDFQAELSTSYQSYFADLEFGWNF